MVAMQAKPLMVFENCVYVCVCFSQTTLGTLIMLNQESLCQQGQHSHTHIKRCVVSVASATLGASSRLQRRKRYNINPNTPEVQVKEESCCHDGPGVV